MADKVKHILNKIDGIGTKELKGINVLSEKKQIEALYTAIRSIKQNILLDEFSYSEMDPVKNAINKSFHKGGDYYLSLLVNLIKKSGNILDYIEEQNAKSS